MQNARGLPGILVDGGGEVVLYHACVVRGCKLGLSASNLGLGVGPFPTSTVHVLTNQLRTERNDGPGEFLTDFGRYNYYF